MNVSDYCTDAVKAVEWMTEWRGALEYNAVYDPHDEDDYKYFLDKYGIDMATELRDSGLHYVDGLGYKEPAPVTLDEVDAWISIEDVVEMIDQGWEESLAEFLDLPRLMEDANMIEQVWKH